MKRLVNLRNLLALRPALMICTVTSCVLIAGCIFDGLGPPDKEPTITGVITNVETDGTSLRVLIEENPDVPVEGDQDLAGSKMILWVDGTSIYVQRDNGSWYLGRKEDLRLGSTARAWASSIVDTYPGRGVADDIAVLSTASH